MENYIPQIQLIKSIEVFNKMILKPNGNTQPTFGQEPDVFINYYNNLASSYKKFVNKESMNNLLNDDNW